MSRRYKNIVLHNHTSIGEERRKALAKEAMRDNTPFPKTLTYEDIDKEFKRWVEEELDLSFEGSRIPTMVLFSNQKFSEYMQSWQFNDDKRNIILNFKTVSRENNPKIGELVGQSRNIPGERMYTIRKELCQDENGRDYFRVYKMKQPFTIDLSYKIGIITNKFELINKFNAIVNEKFKSIDCYIRPNGHFIPMKLNDVSDDSELSIDDRSFYSQSYNITVMAYIINEDSFEEFEMPVLRFTGVDFELTNDGKCSVEIEDGEDGETTIYSEFISGGQDKAKFQIDTDININDISVKNISSFELKVNDRNVPVHIVEDKCYTEITYNNIGEIIEKSLDEIELSDGDEIKITKVCITDSRIRGEVIFNGKIRKNG